MRNTWIQQLKDLQWLSLTHKTVKSSKTSIGSAILQHFSVLISRSG
jgi:hypothetical protein